MMRWLKLCIVALLVGCTARTPTPTAVLTVATFNLEWLGDGINDRKERTEQDLQRMAEVITELNADLIGIQEVENPQALRRLLRYLPGYEGAVGALGRQQNVGLLYRRTVQVQLLGEYTPLIVEPGRTRPGFLAYCRAGNFDFYVMVVHLKSSSRYDSTEELRQRARELRQRQAEQLARWVDSLLHAGPEQDVLLIGDFNDTPKRKRYPTLQALVEHPSLHFLTADLRSCRYERAYTIDHIVVTTSALQRYKSGSAFVANFYARFPFTVAEQISDHCPVVAQFDVSAPDND